MVNKTGMMEVAIGTGVVQANAKTGMIDMKSLEKVGNMFNGLEQGDKGYRRLVHWLKNKDTLKFIDVLKKRISANFSNEELIIKKIGKKRYQKTFAHPMVALSFAEWLGLEPEVVYYELQKQDEDIFYYESESFLTYRDYNRIKMCAKSESLISDDEKYLYVIEVPQAYDSYCKIGITSNIKQRVKQLQTGNYFKIEVTLLYDTYKAEELEKYLHNIFKESRGMGEWFGNLNADDVDTEIQKWEKLVEVN